MDVNHCEIVEKSLSGERAVDEQTFSSAAILRERLERLKKLDERFATIGFSRGARKLLKSQKNAVAIC
jgi:predicted esterase